jgi:hypothetical protein
VRESAHSLFRAFVVLRAFATPCVSSLIDQTSLIESCYGLAGMRGGILRRGRALLLLAALTTLLSVVGVGCGSSSDPEITVQTGTLSKTEFTEKADTICKAARTEFVAKYTRFAEENKSTLFPEHPSKEKTEAKIGELVDTILTPNIEGEIAKISELGAPKAYAPQAAAFLNALQTKLEAIQNDPHEIGSSPFPFKKAEDAARRAGMYGCAESFS